LISKNPVAHFNIPAEDILNKLPVGLLILKRHANSFHIDYFNGSLPRHLPSPGVNQDFLEWIGLDEGSLVHQVLVSINHEKENGEAEIRLGSGIHKELFQLHVSSFENSQLMITLVRRKADQGAQSKPMMTYDWLIDYLPMTCILLLDQNKKCVNTAGFNLKLFKFSSDELAGKYLKEIVRDKKSLQQIERKLQLASGSDQEFVLKKGTRYYNFSIHQVPEHLKGLHWVLLIQDVSQQTNTKQELENKLRDLARSNNNLEQFAYVASHDLQEPLRKIRAFGDRLFLKYSEVLDDTGQDYLNRMQNAAGRMQILIEDLLKFSRLARLESNFESVDLNLLFQDVISDLEDSIMQSEAKVESDPLPQIMIDPSQFRHLFQNLLSNAIKFHRPDLPPFVKISYSYETNGPEIGGRKIPKIKSHHRFEIRDNGIGFDEKYLDRIFNIFQRLHGRHEYPGTGIGLAICKKVVDNHHGIIVAKSKPNQGSVFIVIIPNQLNKYD